MLLKNNSLTGKNWILNTSSQSHDISLETLSKTLNINPNILNIILNKGVDISNIPHYLNPKLKNMMLDPYELDDMEKTCQIIIKHLKNSKIVIFGDYDVDGITSTAILYNYLSNLSNNIYTYIPDRYQEGYGITFKALENVYKLQPDLIILLDNGSVAYNEIAEVISKGIEIVVVDHHAIEFKPLPANAFINPQKPNDKSNTKYLCSVGLTFLLITALNRLLRDNNYYNTNNININITDYLPLVALGTICDMVPLHGMNRAFIKTGLESLNLGKNLPLACLLEVINNKEPVSYETLGFQIGPCINAGSRMGQSTLPLRLLTTKNPQEAYNLSHELIKLNEKRKDEENKIIQHAVAEIENNKNSSSIIFAGSNDYSAGVIGIVASRLKEIYNKPACIFSIDTTSNTAVASGRSIEGLHLGNIILNGVNKGIFSKGGGHSQAVGFSFDYSKYTEVFEFLNTEVQKITTNQLATNYDTPNIYVDSIISLLSINSNFVDELYTLCPFGMGFEEPIFLLQNVKLTDVKVIGSKKNHISLCLSDGLKYKIRGVSFKSFPGLLGSNLINNENNFIDVLVKLKRNYYLGKKNVTFHVVDIGSS